MIMTLRIFRSEIQIDTTKNQTWNVTDSRTRLTYVVSNVGFDITVQLGMLNEEFGVTKAWAGPAGQPCPTCNGTGRL